MESCGRSWSYDQEAKGAASGIISTNRGPTSNFAIGRRLTPVESSLQRLYLVIPQRRMLPDEGVFDRIDEVEFQTLVGGPKTVGLR